MKGPRFVAFTSTHADGEVIAVRHVLSFNPAVDDDRDGGTWIHLRDSRSVWVAENWKTVQQRLEGHGPWATAGGQIVGDYEKPR